MEKKFIDFSQAGFPPLIIDYLDKKENTFPLYSYFPDINEFSKIIEQKKGEKIDRILLHKILTEHYTELPISPGVKGSLESIKNENTFTVTTGHQLNIFTGPLYFVYKIISTINLAEKLAKAYPAYNFIPVYWMASEDHDFEEINHIHLFGKTLTWEQEQKGRTGKTLTSSLLKVIDELKLILGDSENALSIVSMIESAYLKNINLASATKHFVNELFGKYGLLILDADHIELKKVFIPVMKEDIFQSTHFEKVNNTIAELELGGYKSQVNPRAINLFYINEGLRERIIKEGDNYKVLNSDLSFSKEEINKAIDEHPENFSPNVVLRPLYQEMLLPNIAYVGGPGELAYWLEFKKMFDHHSVTFPILVLRNSVLWIDAPNRKKMEYLGLKEEELFEDSATLEKKHLQNSGALIDLKMEQEKLQKFFEEILGKVIKLDVSLKPSVEAEHQKTVNGLKNLEEKILRAQKKKSEVSLQQIRALKEKLFPESSIQERYDNFIPFYLKYGPDFIKILKENLDPFERKIIVLF